MPSNLLDKGNNQPRKKKNAIFTQEQSKESQQKEPEKIQKKDETQETKVIEEERKEEFKKQEVEIVPTEQVQTKTVTVIDKKNTQLESIKNEIQFTKLENEYFERIKEIRQKIDNPTPVNRLNKRRKYSEDRRRNVTFSIREDISYLIDDLVDDAKIFKGLCQDEIILLGMQEYIKKYRLK